MILKLLPLLPSNKEMLKPEKKISHSAVRCCKATDLTLAEEGFEYRYLKTKTSIFPYGLRRTSD